MKIRDFYFPWRSHLVWKRPCNNSVDMWTRPRKCLESGIVNLGRWCKRPASEWPLSVPLTRSAAHSNFTSPAAYNIKTTSYFPYLKEMCPLMHQQYGRRDQSRGCWWVLREGRRGRLHELACFQTGAAVPDTRPSGGLCWTICTF